MKPRHPKRTGRGFILLTVIFLAGCAGRPAPATATHVPPTETKTPLPSLTSSPTPTITVSPTVTSSPTPTDTPTPTPTPLGGSGFFLLDGLVCEIGKCEDSGIFLANVLTLEIQPIAEEKYKMIDLSPGGELLLVAQENQLFVLNRDWEIQSLVSDNFRTSWSAYAYWSSDSTIVYLGETPKSNIYLTHLDRGETAMINTGKQVLRLHPTTNNEYIYWGEGYETGSGVYNTGTWRTAIALMEHTKFGYIYPVVSPSGAYFAYQNFEDPLTFYLSRGDGTETVQIDTLQLDNNEHLEMFSWSPAEDRFLAMAVVCDPKCTAHRHFLLTANGELIDETPIVSGDPTLYGSWSPDGQVFIYQVMQLLDGSVRTLDLVQLNTVTMESQVLDFDLPENFYIHQIEWLP